VVERLTSRIAFLESGFDARALADTEGEGLARLFLAGALFEAFLGELPPDVPIDIRKTHTDLLWFRGFGRITQ